MLIQYILIIAIGLIVIRLILKLRAKEIKSVEFFGWLVIWLLAGVVIVFPDVASYLAIQLGVTRGADLIIYISVVMIFYLLSRIFTRLNKTDKDITKIVRHLSLQDEKSNDSPR